MTTLEQIEDLCGENYSLKEEKQRCQEAESRDCVVMQATPHQLFIDLDSYADLVEFKARLPFLQRKGLAQKVTIENSSGGNYHAIIEIDATMPPLDAGTAYALQAIMCSDWKREAINCLRLIAYGKSKNLLFQPKVVTVVEVIER